MGSPTTDDAGLQFISKNFVTLQVDDKKYYNGHYSKVVDEFINKMKYNDLFNELFEKLVFTGSYYEDLKISKPEEYDVNVVMKLPVNYDTLELKCKKVSAGFVKVRAVELDQAATDSSRNKHVYKDMYSWTDNDGFLLQDQIRSWMFSVVDKTMASLTENNASAAEITIDGETYKILRRSNGPAITLNITMPNGATVDVDLVPVVELKWPLHWPTRVRRNPFLDKESWFIVPKDNSKDKREYRNTYWRMSFQLQEKELMKDRGLLKPVCRLLKKLRDTAGLTIKIPSYYIKTICLSAVDEEGDSYWKNTRLSQLFLKMLTKLTDCFANRVISYYWNNEHNLLTASGMSNAEMADIHSHLRHILVEITKNMSSDPTVFAKYLLAGAELRKFKREYLKMELPSMTVSRINDDRRVAQLQKENIALKKAMTQKEQKHDTEVNQILQLLNHLKIAVESLDDKQERQQSGINYLFYVSRQNEYRYF